MPKGKQQEIFLLSEKGGIKKITAFQDIKII